MQDSPDYINFKQKSQNGNQKSGTEAPDRICIS